MSDDESSPPKSTPGEIWERYRKGLIGRNQYCPCRSGLKFKQCCLPKIRAAEAEAERERYRRRMATMTKPKPITRQSVVRLAEELWPGSTEPTDASVPNKEVVEIKASNDT
jgi:hypothetical protein